MAKIFADSEIFRKTWYRKLPPKAKCLWEWLRCNCDRAGVCEFDPELASFQIGEEVDWSTLELFGDRIERLNSHKIFIVDFISFQYGTLSQECKPHKPVFLLLQKHDLLERVLKGFPKGFKTFEEKEKEKDKDKEKEKEKEKEKNKKDLLFATSVFELWNKIAKEKKLKTAKNLNAKRKTQIKACRKLDGLESLEGWEIYFEKVAQSDWLSGRSKWGGAGFDWVINPNNAIKVAEGQYENRSAQVLNLENPYA